MSRIIQVTTFFYPVHGGVERLVLDLSKRLKNRGHIVKVITSDSSKGYEKIQPLSEEIEGVQVERCKTWLSLSKFHKFFPSIFFKLLSEDFDLIHVHGIKKVESYIALFVAKLKRKKIVISTHNPFVVDPKQRSYLSNLFIKIHDLTFGKLFMRYFDKFICLSKTELKFLSKFGVRTEQITVIPNAISEDAFEPGDPRKVSEIFDIDKKNFESVVLFLGRISKRKGVQNLFSAAKHLNQTLFLFAGPDDGFVKELRGLFKGLVNVRFLGPVDRNDTKHLYGFADIFVLPSLYEPFGIVLLEAMAQGLPIIASNVGGPREIIKPNFGILQDPKDQDAWSENIQRLLDNEKLREKMGVEAEKEAGKYRWSSVIARYLKVYGA